jgi:HD-like signal output (HDOD) protein
MTAHPHSALPNRQRLYRLLSAVPPFHPVAVQLLRLVDGPSQDLAQMVTLLRSDAVMVTELVRTANSPLFANRYEIKNPLHALVYLGLERVKALVATIAVKGLSNATRSAFSHSGWRHSLATALICQRLAPSVNLSPERCYMGGLIHDLGRLALLAVFPVRECLELLNASTSLDLILTERRLFGLDHTEAGSWLLSQWGCPLEWQNIAAFHENPDAAPNCDRAVVGLVHAASQLADSIGMPVFASLPLRDLREIASSLSEIGSDGLSLDLADIAEWVATRVNGIETCLY